MNKVKKIISYACYPLILVAAAILLIIASGADPVNALSIFWNGIFGNKNSFCEVFVKATPLILTGLACAVAFRTGFFNIGAEGQFYIGAIAASAIALRCDFIPPTLRIICAFAAGFIAGGLWSLIAALFKLKFKISEIIVTIMLTYIAVNFLGVAVRTFLQDPAGNMPQSEKLENALVLPKLLVGTRLHPGFFIALAMALLVWFVMDKTTWGYELRVVGFNPRAAQCCGISVTGGVIRAAMLSGGLAGMAGVIEVLAIQKKLLESFSADCGYTGVLIALLAANKPQLVPFVAILYAAVTVGAATMQRRAGVPSAMVNVLIGFAVVVLLMRSMFTGKKKEVKKHA